MIKFIKNLLEMIFGSKKEEVSTIVPIVLKTVLPEKEVVKAPAEKIFTTRIAEIQNAKKDVKTTPAPKQNVPKAKPASKPTKKGGK